MFVDSPTDSVFRMFALVFVVPGALAPLPAFYSVSLWDLSLLKAGHVRPVLPPPPRKEALYAKNYDFKLIIYF